MRTLLLTALLLVSPGAARAEGAPASATTPEAPERPAPSAKAEPSGAKAKRRPAAPPRKKVDAGAKTAEAPEKVPAPAAAKPCEPVKPCPID